MKKLMLAAVLFSLTGIASAHVEALMGKVVVRVVNQAPIEIEYSERFNTPDLCAAALEAVKAQPVESYFTATGASSTSTDQAKAVKTIHLGCYRVTMQ